MKRFLLRNGAGSPPPGASGNSNGATAGGPAGGRMRSATANSALSTTSAMTAASSVSLESSRDGGRHSSTQQERQFAEFLKLTSAQDVQMPLGPIQINKLNKLQRAVFDNNVTRTKSLLKQRSRDVNKLDSTHGMAALHVAASFNCIECALLLLKAPSVLKLTGTTSAGLANTPPFLHAGNGSGQGGSSAFFAQGPPGRARSKTTTLMALKTCDVNMKDRNGRTPLMLAVMGRHLEMVRLLLENNASLGVTDNAGATSMHYAIVVNDMAIVQTLLHKRAPTALVDLGGYTLLQHTLRLRRPEIAVALISRGVFVNEAYANDNGQTPLHLAVRLGLPTVVRALLQHGAKPNIRDADSHTADAYATTPEIAAMLAEPVTPLTPVELPRTSNVLSASSAASGPSSRAEDDGARRSSAGLLSGTARLSTGSTGYSAGSAAHSTGAVGRAAEDSVEPTELEEHSELVVSAVSEGSAVPEHHGGDHTEDLTEADEEDDAGDVVDDRNAENQDEEEDDLSSIQDIDELIAEDGSEEMVAAQDALTESASVEAPAESRASLLTASQLLHLVSTQRATGRSGTFRRSQGSLLQESLVATPSAMGTGLNDGVAGAADASESSQRAVLLDGSCSVSEPSLASHGAAASVANRGTLASLTAASEEQLALGPSRSVVLSAPHLCESTGSFDNAAPAPISEKAQPSEKQVQLAMDDMCTRTVLRDDVESRAASQVLHEPNAAMQLQEVRSELEAVVAAKTELAESYRRRLEMAESDLAAIQRAHALSIQELQAELEALRADQQTTAAAHDAARAETDRALQARLAELERAQSGANHAESQVAQLQAALQDAENARDQHRDTCASLEGQLRDQQAFDERVAALTAQAAALESEMAAKTAQAAAIERQLHEASAQLAKEQGSLRAVEAQLRAAEQALQVSEVAVLTEHKRVEEERARNETLSRQIQLLRQMADPTTTTPANPTTAQNTEASAGGAFGVYKAYTVGLEGDLLQAQRKLHDAQTQLGELGRARQQDAFRNDELVEQLRTASERLRKEKQSNQQHRETLARVQNDLDQLRTASQALQDRLQAVEASESDAREELAKQLQARTQTQLEQTRLRSEVDLLQQKLASERAALDSKSTLIEQLRQQIKLLSAAAVAPLSGKGAAAVSDVSEASGASAHITRYYEAEISSLYQQLKDERALRVSKEQETLAVGDALNDVEASLAELRSLYENEVVCSKQLRAVKERLVQELASAQKTATQLQQTVHEQSLQQIQASSRAQELETRLSDQAAAFARAEGAQAQAQADIAQLQDDLRRRYEAESELQARVVVAEARFKQQTALEEAVAAKQARLDAAVQNEAQLRARAEQLAALNQQLDRQIVELQAGKQQLQAQVANLSDSLARQTDAAQREQQTAEARVRQQQDDSARSAKAADSLSAQLSQMQDALAGSQRQIAELGEAKRAVDAALQSANDSLQRERSGRAAHEDGLQALLERGRPLLNSRLAFSNVQFKELAAQLSSAAKRAVATEEATVAQLATSCEALQDQLAGSLHQFQTSVAAMREDFSHDVGRWEGAFGNGEGDVDTSLDARPSGLVIKKLVRAQNQRLHETHKVLRDLEHALGAVVETADHRFHALVLAAQRVALEQRTHATQAAQRLGALREFAQGDLAGNAGSARSSPLMTALTLGDEADASVNATPMAQIAQHARDIESLVRVYQTRLGEARERLAETRAERDALAARADALDATLKDQRSRETHVSDDLKTVEATCSQLKEAATRQTAQLAQARDALAASDRRLGELEAVAAERAARLVELEQTLRRYETLLETTRTERDAARAASAAAAEKALQAEAHAQRDDARAREQLEHLSSAHATATSDLAATRTVRDETLSALERANGELRRVSEERTRLEQTSAAHQRRAASLETALHRAQLELEASRSARAKVESEYRVVLGNVSLAAAAGVATDAGNVRTRPSSPLARLIATNAASARGEADSSAAILQALVSQLQQLISGLPPGVDGTGLEAFAERLGDTAQFVRQRSSEMADERQQELQVVQRETAARRVAEEALASAETRLAALQTAELARADAVARNAELDARVRELTEEVSTLKRECTGLETARATLQGRAADAEQQLGAARESHDTFRAHSDSLRAMDHENTAQARAQAERLGEQLATLEENNRRLVLDKGVLVEELDTVRDELAQATSRLRTVERNARAKYNDQLRSVVERMELQAVERAELEGTRAANERALLAENDKQVDTLRRELAGLRDVLATERAGAATFETLARDRAAQLEAELDKAYLAVDRLRQQTRALETRVQMHQAADAATAAANVQPREIPRNLAREVDDLKRLVVETARAPLPAAPLLYTSVSSPQRRPAVALDGRTKRFELLRLDGVLASPTSPLSPTSARTLVSSPLHSPQALAYAAASHVGVTRKYVPSSIRDAAAPIL